MACWAVLIAGETHSAMKQDRQKTRAGKYLGSHCSLNNIGRAYAAIARMIPTTNIIVIAQLRETLEWLEDATSSPERCAVLTGRDSLFDLMKRRLEETKAACAELLARGGADYDHHDVNPATVLRVLSGDPTLGERVLPSTCASVLLVLNSHGNAHTVAATPHAREWYAHLPYPVPPTHEHIYQYASFEDYYSDDEERLHDHRCILYSQLLFQALHVVHTRPAPPAMLFVNQSCLSEGLSRFLALPSYRAAHATHRWRMLSISTARELQPSLGDFLLTWLARLTDAVDAGGSASLMAVYQAAADRYHQDNPNVPPYVPPPVVAESLPAPPPAAALSPPVHADPSAIGSEGHSAPAAAADAAAGHDESPHFGQLVCHMGDPAIADLSVRDFLCLNQGPE